MKSILPQFGTLFAATVIAHADIHSFADSTRPANAESYFLIGKSLGDNMVDLLAP